MNDHPKSSTGTSPLSLSSFPLLEHCSQAGLERMSASGEEIICKKGQAMVHEGEPIHGIYFILKGKMKVVTEGLFGKEQILRLAGEKDIVGHRGINSEERFPVGIEALEDCHTFHIPLKAFYAVLQKEAAFSFDLMFFFADQLMATEKRMKRLSQLQVHERVAYALLYIRSIFGVGTGAFPLPLSRSEIGDLAATTQDQASRYLSEFRRKGVIHIENGRMTILDLPYLRSLSQG